MKKEIKADYIIFLYRIGLFTFNTYLFFKLTSFAMNFARIYATSYKPIISHLLILLFGYAYFVVFTNLTRLVFSMEETDSAKLMKTYTGIAFGCVIFLFVLLLVQIIPEFLFSMATQY